MLQKGVPRFLRVLTAVAWTGILVGCAGEPASQAISGTSAAPREASSGDAAASADDKAKRYDSIMRVARLSEKGKDLTTAMGLYQRAHEADPTQADPLLRLATIYREAGQIEQAAEAYRRLVLIEPNNPDHLLQYGMLLLRVEKTAEAQRQFLRARRLQEDARTLNAIGVTYDMEGERSDAQRHYRDALALDPSYLPAMGNLGLSLALSGDHQAGIALLEDTVATPNSGPEHRRMLATAHGLAGDMAAASQVSGQAFDAVALRENLKIYGAAE